MKVLLVATRIDHEGGGAAAAARQLALGLRRFGHEVVVVATQRAGSAQIEDGDGIRYYRFRPRNLYWIGDKDTKPPYQRAIFQTIDLWNAHVYQTLRAIIAHEQPAVVHTHKLRGLSPSVWTAARAACPGSRLVHTCHDHELISPEGTLTGRLGQLAMRGSGWLWPYQAIRRAQSRSVAIVAAPSRLTLERHTALGYFPGAQSCVVPNSHGLSQAELDALYVAANRQSGEYSGRTRLLYLGRLDRIKGVDVLCAAFEQAVGARPALQLDVAGSGVLLDSLRQRYAHLPQLVFHGHVQGDRKRELLAAADALVVPTVGQEVFGIVIVEAFAHGKPVIATATGGIPEVVREGETGFLVEPGRVECLVDRMIWASDNVTSLRAMEPACFAAAPAYTLEAIANAYLTVYGVAHVAAGGPAWMAYAKQ